MRSRRAGGGGGADRLCLPNFLHRLRRFGSVQLRVDLGHDWGGIAQDGAGNVQAELTTEPGRRVVAFRRYAERNTLTTEDDRAHRYAGSRRT